LTVGPQSAGSRPGPVCYGSGGREPTVTDANVALGRLSGDSFLGGAMQLNAVAARTAIAETIAAPLGFAPEAAAEGLLAVTNANLGAAIRLSLFEKGLDPRDFAMIAFGGAAGLHAIAVADELGIKRVIFPENASTLSAYGMLHSDLKHDLAHSHVLRASADNLPRLAAAANTLFAAAQAQLTADAIAGVDRRIELPVDMRYLGQAFELTVPARAVSVDSRVLQGLIADFHDAHRQRFSYANPGSPVEIVALRVSAVGRLPKPPAITARPAKDKTAPQRRKIWMTGEWCEVDVFSRDHIGLDGMLVGPVIIEEAYTTVLLASGWSCRRHQGGHLIAWRCD
jgi:N-methylhydantoinase A